MKTKIFILVALVMAAIHIGFAQSSIPKVITYQGVLTENDGIKPVANGEYTITFKIHLDSTTTSSVWDDTFKTTVENGLFTVDLGSNSTKPLSILPFDRPYWLSIGYEKDAVKVDFKNRIRFTSAPYAFYADLANKSKLADSSAKAGEATVALTAKALDSVAEQRLTQNGSSISITKGGSVNIGLISESSNGDGLEKKDSVRNTWLPNNPANFIKVTVPAAGKYLIMATMRISGGIQVQEDVMFRILNNTTSQVVINGIIGNGGYYEGNPPALLSQSGTISTIANLTKDQVLCLQLFVRNADVPPTYPFFYGTNAFGQSNLHIIRIGD